MWEEEEEGAGFPPTCAPPNLPSSTVSEWAPPGTLTAFFQSHPSVQWPVGRQQLAVTGMARRPHMASLSCPLLTSPGLCASVREMML